MIMLIRRLRCKVTKKFHITTYFDKKSQFICEKVICLVVFQVDNPFTGTAETQRTKYFSVSLMLGAA